MPIQPLNRNLLKMSVLILRFVDWSFHELGAHLKSNAVFNTF